jgi:hypothetical protein
MLHDGIIAMKRAAASRQRWKMAEDQDHYDNLHIQKRGNGADLHIQNPSFASIEAEAKSTEASKGGFPLEPPSRKKPPQTPPRDGGASVFPFAVKKGDRDDGA